MRLKTQKQLTMRPARNGKVNMQARPYKIVDRRNGTSGGRRKFKSSTRPVDRPFISSLDADHHRTVGPADRKTILTMARWLESNFPAIEAAITEQANYAVASWTPVYKGQNQDWGSEAIEWLTDWESVMDIGNRFTDGETFRETMIREVLIDGDQGIILVDQGNGFPGIQVVRSHRIATPSGNTEGNLIDGVVVNAQLKPTAYVLVDPNGKEQRRISANDFILVRQAEHSDQRRGISKLGSSIFLWEDVDEARNFELIAHKACSAHTLVESNETGELDESSALVQSDATVDTATEKRTALTIQKLEGGLYRYITANSGHKIEPMKYDRPGPNAQNFQIMVETHAFRGLDWDRQFSLDPSKLGGAAMRVVVDKMNRTIRRRQRMVKRISRLIHIWALSRAMNLGLVSRNDEEMWFRHANWDYKTDSLLTADAKYQSDVDVQEYNAMFKTLEDIHGLRGVHWEERIRQYAREKRRIQEIMEEEGVQVPAPATPEPNRTPREPIEDEDEENEDNQEESDSDGNED